MYFGCGRHAIIRLHPSQMHPHLCQTLRIVTLDSCGFIMSATNGLVQITCTSTLQRFGDDVYVSAMTTVNSVREASLPH